MPYAEVELLQCRLTVLKKQQRKINELKEKVKRLEGEELAKGQENLEKLISEFKEEEVQRVQEDLQEATKRKESNTYVAQLPKMIKDKKNPLYYESEKASITGDTVGDPLKDTSGPSLNILIKLSSIISVVFGTLFLQTSYLI